MHKVLVFDLDGTLAPIGKGMSNDDIELLRRLEQKGYIIAICSGKPSYYLCGFMRQVGISRPILIGENGGTIQFGVDLPPTRYYTFPYDDAAKQQIQSLKGMIDENCKHRVWYQPNEVGLTPFPQNKKTFNDIQRIIDSECSNLDSLIVYRHVDSFDITPESINKYNGLTFLSSLLQIEQGDFIAVGDGINDVPMFEFADCSIGIGKKLEYKTDYLFENISEGLHYILANEL